MNLSISALRINSLSSSPVISASSANLKHFTTFHKIDAKNLFSSFYFSSFQKNLQVVNSRFQSCLNSVIKMNEIGFDNSTRYNRIEGTQMTGNIQITNCVFYKISTIASEGGAIYLKFENQKNSAVILKSNGFYLCKCTGSDGAFYLQVYNVYADKNCFTNCTATTGKMVGMIKGGRDGNVEFNTTSVYLCAPNVEQGSQHTVMIMNGFQRTYHDNFTQNHLTQSYPVYVLTPTANSNSLYTTIHSCEGQSFVMFYPGSMGKTPSRLLAKGYLFINNTINNDLFDIMGPTVDIEDLITHETKLKAQNQKLIISLSTAQNVTLRNCQTDFEIEKHSTTIKANLIKEDCNVITLKKFVPITHTLNPSAQCWVNLIEKPKTMYEFVIQWKRTLILVASMIGVVLIALIAKRIYQNFKIVSKNEKLNDTETIFNNNANDSAFNYQYDFDMI